MHIHDDHQHYGSALIQIAEDPHFTAINAFKYRGRNSRCGFRINQDIGVHVRYRTESKGQRIPIYSFMFNQDNLAELERMNKRLEAVHLALVCVADREICCLPYAQFMELIETRRSDVGHEEDDYVIEVWLAEGKRFRVGISPPHQRGTWSKHFIIPRNDFPRSIFQNATSDGSAKADLAHA
jgi:hypothetical protein